MKPKIPRGRGELCCQNRGHTLGPLIHEFSNRTVPAFQFLNEVVVMAKAQDGVDDQIAAESDQSRVERQERHQEPKDIGRCVVLGSRHQNAQDRQWQCEYGDACAQAGVCSPLLSQEELNLAENRLINAVLLVRTHRENTTRFFTPLPRLMRKEYPLPRRFEKPYFLRFDLN